MQKRLLFSLVAGLAPLVSPLGAEQTTLTITVTAGKHACKNVPISVPVRLPEQLAKARFAKLTDTLNKDSQIGTLTLPGITTEAIGPSSGNKIRRDLHFVVADLGAGKSVTWQCIIPVGLASVPIAKFLWKDTKGEYTDLLFFDGSEPTGVLRYMYHAYDNSSRLKRDQTYKVFHHMFDPTGTRLVTNGGFTDQNIADPKKLLYPHHRGLMYAFNRITYDGNKKADTWHALPGDTHQEHVKFLSTEADRVLGRHRVLIDWHGPKNEVFSEEERELTVNEVPGGTLVDFVSRLKTTGGLVKLDGDPQHAGFQFRAANAVAEKTEKQTYFLRPDGKGKLNDTRNWPKDKGHVNLPWDAMSFVLDGKRYTVAYLNHPSNPGEQRYSERAYGRIGCYFAYDLTEDRPLVVRYRIWLQEGEMTVDQVQALSRAFVDPPRVTVK
jgi:hypothetical protein